MFSWSLEWFKQDCLNASLAMLESDRKAKEKAAKKKTG